MPAARKEPLKETFCFGNLEATDEEIVEAAGQPMSITLSGYPGGYNMEMNQESSNISLGQKQP